MSARDQWPSVDAGSQYGCLGTSTFLKNPSQWMSFCRSAQTETLHSLVFFLPSPVSFILEVSVKAVVWEREALSLGGIRMHEFIGKNAGLQVFW